MHKVVRTCGRIAGFSNRLAAVAIATLSATGACAGSVQLPAGITEYVPFEVTVTTDAPHCVGFPIVGDMQYSSATLVTVLTHLGAPGEFFNCPNRRATTRRVGIPGLPRGQQTLRFEVTEGSNVPDYTGARVAETITTTVNVAPIASGGLATFWTGTYTPELGDGKILGFYLKSSRLTMFNGGNDWIEIGPAETGYTFKSLQTDAGVALPSALARLNWVAYPAPYSSGVFWTADAVTANRLASEWGNPRNETNYAVGKLVAGACPIGMSPVYQAFHPATVTHRWTQSRTAYSTMLVNGYQGDGAVWCALALRGE